MGSLYCTQCLKVTLLQFIYHVMRFKEVRSTIWRHVEPDLRGPRAPILYKNIEFRFVAVDGIALLFSVNQRCFRTS